MPCAQFQTKKVDYKVWHPTCFPDVPTPLLPDNLLKINARLYVMQHITMNPSPRKQIILTTKDMIQKYTPFLIMEAVHIKFTAKMPFQTILCI